MHVAIIGLGPWGLAALDRLIAAARRRPGLVLRVTAIDARSPGPGVHDPDDSELLLLNTVAGQVDSFGAAHFGEPALPGALPLLAWVRRNGYPDATADTFLPRVAFGRYLGFVFGVLRDAARSVFALDVVRAQVMAIEPFAGGRARLALAGGPVAIDRWAATAGLAASDRPVSAGAHVVADRVLLCTGHGLPRTAAAGSPYPIAQLDAAVAVPRVPAPLAPYPIAQLDAAVGAARSVGIAGLGLVAVDVVAALTEGRGGRFERVPAGGLVYHPSGREPCLFPYSRSGVPFACRPVTTPDLATRYDPVYCTAERVAALHGRANLELVADVLAPMFAEMRAAYAVRAVALAHGEAAADQLRRRLRGGPISDADAALDREIPAVAAFRPAALVLAERLPAGDEPASFRDAFVDRLAHDVAEARKGETGSPYKTAVEILRVVRHFLRAGVEHGRLAPASRARFHQIVAPRISQLIVGPPVVRGEQWLALIDAGIVRLELGAAPDIRRNWTRAKWRAEVAGTAVTTSTHLDHLILGHLDSDPPDAAGDGLWQRLCADGLCTVTRDGGRASPRLDACGHLIDATGQVVPMLSAFGVPSEGPTYFNHYLPSPRSRAGAFERLRDAIDMILRAAVAAPAAAAAGG